MAEINSKYKYDVCLSFAGEERWYVQKVVEQLESKGVRVFYDDDKVVESWGKDLCEYFDRIYRIDSLYCVMFISEAYASKLWTGLERRSAMARAFSEKREYILPARFDDTDIPGLPPTIGYINLRVNKPYQFAQMIIDKLNSQDNSNIEEKGKEVFKDDFKLEEVTNELIKRFLQVFELHDIGYSELPIFIDKKFNIGYNDINSKGNLLNKLNDDLLQWVTDTFGVEKEWILGTTDSMYKYIDFYKQIHRFIDFMFDLKKEQDFEIYALKTRALDKNSKDEQSVFLIVKVKIKNLNSKVIYKFIPISTDWKWDYWRTRYQLKSIFYIVTQKFRKYLWGYDLKNYEEFQYFLKGKISFGDMIRKNNRSSSYTWYPEDYIYLEKESAQAKDIDEVENIYKYIEEEKYLTYFEAKYKEFREKLYNSCQGGDIAEDTNGRGKTQ